MIGVGEQHDRGQAQSGNGLYGGHYHFIEVDVIRVKLGERNGISNLRIFTVAVRNSEGHRAEWC